MSDSPGSSIDHGPGPLAGARFRYLFLTARDFASLVAFYRDVLGLHVAYFAEDEFAFLEWRAGEAPALAIYPGRDEPDGQPEDGGRNPHWFPVFDVDDIEVTVAALESRGVSVDPIHAVPHGRAAFFRDPEGNRIEIHQPDA